MRSYPVTKLYKTVGITLFSFLIGVFPVFPYGTGYVTIIYLYISSYICIYAYKCVCEKLGACVENLQRKYKNKFSLSQ